MTLLAFQTLGSLTLVNQFFEVADDFCWFLEDEVSSLELLLDVVHVEQVCSSEPEGQSSTWFSL